MALSPVSMAAHSVSGMSRPETLMRSRKSIKWGEVNSPHHRAGAAFAVGTRHMDHPRAMRRIGRKLLEQAARSIKPGSLIPIIRVENNQSIASR